MNEYPKAIKDNDSSQAMECPHCRKVMGTFRDSTFTKKGHKRLRYKNTVICLDCGNKFRMN